MTHKFRAAIFAAVSSDPQAKEDKLSLPDQIKMAREYILEEGGLETGEPFSADGYSRTGYESLPDALHDIPALKAAVEAAAQNKFDVLVVDNWDRLGGLGLMLLTRFKKYNKQLKSARQSGRVRDPKSYNASTDEVTETEIHNAQGNNIYRIQKIRRGWNVGIPGRVENGLHALRIPFGYQLTNKNSPAQLIPEIGAMLQQMKNMMLQGQTYTDIGKWADTIRPSALAPVWTVAAVHRTLCNPFYAGIIRFGVMNKRKPTQKSNWKFAQGKHEPLWDESTYYALISEAKRRMEGKRNYAALYPFSGLTVCGVCDAKVNKHGKEKYEYLACNRKHQHWSMRYVDAVEYLAPKIAAQYQAFQAAPYEPPDLTPLLKKLSGIELLRARIQEGWESGIYTKDEATAKMNKLMDEADDIQHRIDHAEDTEREREYWHARAQSAGDTVRNLDYVIHTMEAGEINRTLSLLIDKIVLKKGEIKVFWRE